MSNRHYDTIVIGAGFAGLVAARELTRAGQRVLLLEARDRLGGRTWLAERMGLDLELGGTWVHWTQPHVWAELTRYGIGLAPSPEPQRAFWWDGTRAVDGDPDELLELLDEPNQLLSSRAREVFPEPFAPLDSPLLDELDGIAVAEHIASLPLTSSQRSLLESFWTLNFNGVLKDAAYTQALRWVALTNGDWKVNFEACATYKIAGGTQALVDAIAADCSADVEYGADVQQITSDGDRVRVQTADGRTFTAADTILTVPLQALSRIDIVPAPPQPVTDAIAAGQVGLGTKVWFTIEGEHPAFVALGAADWPLNFFQSEYVRDGRTFVIGFGADSRAIDVSDTAAIQELLNRLWPQARVLDSAGHDWVGDIYAQETWPMHRAGYLSTALPALQQPLGRVHLAGCDLADGWCGFIDGAIESALKVTRRLLQPGKVAA